ncbi:DUF1707 SHOCT-like domain-containing protein [Rhodococcus sp. NBC_00294]|uniref:DUF1707 SHOCT-like domain-containing protein n=1 Tax=Rhodococcus sp. NBC_00294 TaxID=2976004 RepID=UPI002E29B66C|nr:DUF1707 domain-containing protein [Rhodococcus sp. NBC_00294]
MTAPQTHEQALALLTAAVGDGRLTLDEFDTRSAAVVSARSDADLAAVTADLHPAPSTPGHPTTVPAAAWLRWASVVALCSAIYVITCVASGSMLYPWPVWVAGPWGMVLLVHSIAAATQGLGTVSCGAAAARAARPWDTAGR